MKMESAYSNKACQSDTGGDGGETGVGGEGRPVAPPHPPLKLKSCTLHFVYRRQKQSTYERKTTPSSANRLA